MYTFSIVLETSLHAHFAALRRSIIHQQFFIYLLQLLLVSNELFAYSYKNIHNSELFSIDQNRSFTNIPKSFFLAQDKQPWSGNDWPLYKGGIANRWQGSAADLRVESHTYKTLDQVGTGIFTLTNSELASLSPSEKYDIFSGNFDFPLTKAELKKSADLSARFGTRRIPRSFGNSHGWAAAAMNEPEPIVAVEIPLRHGATLKFYPADIKALLSSYYAHAPADTFSVASNCETELNGTLLLHYFNRPRRSDCQTVNPTSFHLLVTSYILHGKSFVAEISRQTQSGYERSHQPIVGYQYDVIDREDLYVYRKTGLFGRRTVRQKTGKKVRVRMQLYVSSLLMPQPQRQQSVSEHIYNYELRLNLQNQIIGGRWLQSPSKASLLWLQRRVGPDSRGLIDYNQLKSLHEQSYYSGDTQLGL